MQLEIPAQLGGPECRALISAIVELRRILEPTFAEVSVSRITKLVLLLRVGGTVTDFGAVGPQGLHVDEDALVCEIVIGPQAWTDRTPDELRSTLARHLAEGLRRSVADGAIPPFVLNRAVELLSIT